MKEFLDQSDATINEKPHPPITVMWIPGHSEIEGNERADLEAKKAAINPTISRPFHHQSLKST
jgi:ribonuclease HI